MNAVRALTVLSLALLPALAVAASTPAGGAAEKKEAKPVGEKKVTETPDAGVVAVRKFIDAQVGEKKIDKAAAGWKTRLPKFPAVQFTAKKTYYWNLKTSQGGIKVKLMPEVAPQHVANFLYLTELGFFDGLTFHRVIPGFMAQGGCPLGTGTGSPGYRFDGEHSPAVKHDKPGLLSMANAGPGTDGSQFFLTFVPTPWLDGKHTIFGTAVDGLSTLKELEKRGSQSGATTEKMTVDKAWITVE